MKEPQFWIGDFDERIYMTHTWRENKQHPGIFECTGKSFDVTDGVLAVARKHAALKAKPSQRSERDIETDAIAEMTTRDDPHRQCACSTREICNEARAKAIAWYESEKPWVTPEMMVAYKVGYAACLMKGSKP
jgi:hypothetical protein